MVTIGLELAPGRCSQTLYSYRRGRRTLGVKSARVLILCAQSYRVSRLARNVTTVQLHADFLYSLPNCNALMC